VGEKEDYLKGQHKFQVLQAIHYYYYYYYYYYYSYYYYYYSH